MEPSSVSRKQSHVGPGLIPGKGNISEAKGLFMHHPWPMRSWMSRVGQCAKSVMKGSFLVSGAPVLYWSRIKINGLHYAVRRTIKRCYVRSIPRNSDDLRCKSEKISPMRMSRRSVSDFRMILWKLAGIGQRSAALWLPYSGMRRRIFVFDKDRLNHAGPRYAAGNRWNFKVKNVWRRDCWSSVGASTQVVMAWQNSEKVS